MGERWYICLAMMGVENVMVFGVSQGAMDLLYATSVQQGKRINLPTLKVSSILLCDSS